MTKARTGILISGRGSNMLALVEAARQAAFPAEIALVLSDRPTARGIESARAAGVAARVVNYSEFAGDREAFERAIQKALEQQRIELVCLAGFMRLLTPWLVSRWQGRMLNIHPALLPAFTGLNTHARALGAGVKIHGATVHFVTAEMDAGPIVAQGALAVRDEDTTETLAARVLQIEHRIYPLALELLAAGRLRLADGRCVTAGAVPADGEVVVPQIR